MGNPGSAGHDPMQDMLLHFVCVQWARKLAATPMERFSAHDYATFEKHKSTCMRCQELEQQYEAVDASLYDVLFDEYVPLPSHLPSLPWWLRMRYFWQQRVWLSLLHPSLLLRRLLLPGLQLVGVGLLIMLLSLLLFRVHVPLPISPVIIFALALMCIFLGDQGIQKRLRFYSSLLASQHMPSPTRSRIRMEGAHGRVPDISINGYKDSLLQTTDPHTPSVPERSTYRTVWLKGTRIIAVCLLVAICFSSLGWLPHAPASHTVGQTEPTGAPVGISVTGDNVFDTDRPDGDLKRQAASMVAAHNMDAAERIWGQALALESNDAEVLIYKENQAVMTSSHPYFTLVVGAIFAQQHIGGARDILQGAYVAQKEYNTAMSRQPGGRLLRLMIASADVDAQSPQDVAQQIVQAAQKDPTIVGVVGWSTSASVESALPVLAGAHISMVSPTASSDALSGISPYFFRVAPTDHQQAVVAANYVKNVLHAQHIALFVDQNDSYSNSLAMAFQNSFPGGEGKAIQHVYSYVKGDPSTIAVQMTEVLHQQPDLIYFAGYVDDASVVLKDLTSCQQRAQCLLVMGGDGLYVQGNYSLEDFKNYDHLLFTAFAFQMQDQARHPQFFKDYASFYDPNNLYRAGTYGFNATDADAILSYDAVQVYLQASRQYLAQGKSVLTAQGLQALLNRVHVDGVSGPISFDHNGNPIQKGVVILKGSENGKTIIAPQSGLQ